MAKRGRERTARGPSLPVGARRLQSAVHSLDIELLRRIQASQIAAASRGRDVTETGAFVVMLSPNTDLIWLNYAVPTSNDFSAASIESLKKAFEPLKRVPRLEFLETLWPDLSGALEENGFELQVRLPLMLCTKATFLPVILDNFDVQNLGEDSDIGSYLRVMHASFEHDDEVGDADIERIRTSIKNDPTLRALAFCEGKPAAVACLMPEDGVAELAGVGTVSEFRRRGLASAASSLLLEQLFSGPGGDEAIAWLAAGDDTARLVYEKLGFQSIGTQTNYILAGHAS